jgi:hypothetical protein
MGGAVMPMVIPKGTAEYTVKIHGLMKNIRDNSVGKILLASLKKDVTVKPINEYYDPFKKQKEPSSSCRAPTLPDDGEAASPKLKSPKDPDYDADRDKFYKGELSREDDMNDRRFEVHDKRSPTGLGSSSTIYFSSGEPTACSGGKAWNDPELILFHELVHAVRNSQGLSRSVPTRKADWSNEEEFLAVTVANVYLSARDGKKASLRHGHGDNALWPGINTSEGFVEKCDHFDVLKHHADWSVFKDLAAAKGIIFNPFAEYNRRMSAKKPKACVKSM